MIDVEHVTKRFGQRAVLDDLGLSVPQGSIYGLVGPNGAGKSTLIRHIAGIYRPDAGTVRVGGRDPYADPRCKASMQCIYDEVYFYLHATMADIANLDRRLYPGFDEKRYAALTAAFPEIDSSTPLRQMSRGMVKQCAFTLALSCCPQVLLLDEPLDGLDPVMRRQIWSLLANDAIERGMTVLLSSHNLRELEDICDHVGVLNKGKMLLERNIGELEGNVAKVQAIFAQTSDDSLEAARPDLPVTLNILNEAVQGRMHTFIVRNPCEQARTIFESMQPLYLETLPLTLEEIFIYELEGADYAVHDILL